MIGSRFFADWCKDGILRAPSKPKPVFDQAGANSRLLSPLLNWERHPFACNAPCVPSVPNLLCLCGPSAVVRPVALAVVDSVKRVFWRWCKPHVCQEHAEIIPRWANRNTSATIQQKVFVLWVTASLPHARPRSVLFGPSFSSAASRVTVREAGFCSYSAPARFYLASTKFVGVSRFYDSTGASAHPHDSAPAAFGNKVIGPGYCGEVSKHLTRDINTSTHFVTSKLLTVKGAWQSAVNRFSGATLAMRCVFYTDDQSAWSNKFQ